MFQIFGFNNQKEKSVFDKYSTQERREMKEMIIDMIYLARDMHSTEATK